MKTGEREHEERQAGWGRTAHEDRAVIERGDEGCGRDCRTGSHWRH